MISIFDLKQELQATELLSINELTQIFGGHNRDDKRRQRPGGGTTTTSPNLVSSEGRHNRKQFKVYENCESVSQNYEL
jgi:hypothetical protein